MRIKSYRPSTNIYPSNPLTNQPMMGGFEERMEGNEYDLFEHNGGVWVFGKSKRADQGGGIGGIVGAKFTAYGTFTIGGEIAKAQLAEFNAKWPREGAPAAAKAKASATA